MSALTDKERELPPSLYLYFLGGNMRTQNVKLERYGISENLYKELHAFCQQYLEKKSKLNSLYDLHYSTSIVTISNNLNSCNPTERAAEIAEKYSRDIDLIERVAKEVDPKNAKFIIKSVTEDIPPWSLQTRYGMEIGEKTFNKKRRLFYYLLAYYKKCV